MISFEDLPDDILCKICTKLEYSMRSVSMVCKKLYNIIEETRKNFNIYDEEKLSFEFDCFNKEYLFLNFNDQITTYDEFGQKFLPIKIINNLLIFNNHKFDIGNDYQIIEIYERIFIVDMYPDKTKIYILFEDKYYIVKTVSKLKKFMIRETDKIIYSFCDFISEDINFNI